MTDKEKLEILKSVLEVKSQEKYTLLNKYSIGIKKGILYNDEFALTIKSILEEKKENEIMKKELFENVIVRDRDERILGQFYCEKGLKIVSKFSERFECLMQVDIEVDGRYLGTVECWEGSVQRRKYYWDENTDLVFIDEEMREE